MDKDYFDERLIYYGLDDFVSKRVLIKSVFACKTRDEQYMYKLYLYSRPFINDTWKDYQWDYLQSDITDVEFMLNYAAHKRKHSRGHR